jgi:hypothetical protein
MDPLVEFGRWHGADRYHVWVDPEDTRKIDPASMRWLEAWCDHPVDLFDLALWAVEMSAHERQINRTVRRCVNCGSVQSLHRDAYSCPTCEDLPF